MEQEFFFGLLHTSDPTASVWNLFSFLILEYIFYGIPLTIFPLVLVFFATKSVFARKLKFGIFKPFILSVLILLVGASLLWNKFVFNHLYYNWKGYNFSVHLLLHQTPYSNPGAWLINESSLLSLDLIFFVVLVLVFVLSYLISLKWVEKNNTSSYRKTVVIGSLFLLLLAVGFTSWSNSYQHLNAKLAYYQSKDCAQIENPNEYRADCLIETHTVGVETTVDWLANYLDAGVKVMVKNDKFRRLNLTAETTWECATDGMVINNLLDFDRNRAAHLEENKIYKCWPK